MGVAAPARRAGLLAAVAGLAVLGLAAVPAGASAAVVQAAAAGAASSAATVSSSASGPATRAPAVPANARFVTSPRVTAPPSGTRQVCPTPATPGQMTCMALVPTRARTSGPDVSAEDGYQPADLQEAYGLTSASGSAGSGQTVAIVDSYNDPAASTDLSTYRSEFSLPCSTSDGCLKIVNQAGGSALPPADPSGDWELEESLDLDMVSAICPNCSILLVEAKTDNISDLATAEGYAAAHANVVSNSWGSGAEFIGENAFDADFNHPGVPIVAAAGDAGYGTQYPAVSQFVTAVGGTTLTGATGTSPGTQQAWDGTGAGCSSLEAKPAWQTADDSSPGGCLNRTETDVSADANPGTGVAVYDSFGGGGWEPVGGTSVATPIIASVYALSGGLRPDSYPASYPYLHAGSPDLTDVKSGPSNGSCESDRSYLCHARTGYDGPTGLGTPKGTAAFAGPSGGQVTITDPGTRDYQAGSSVHLRLQALDSAGGTLSYSSAGLPAGLRLGSASGLISGKLTSKAGSHTVHVTAAGSGGVHGSLRFAIVVVARIADRHPGSGPVRLDLGDKCLTDAADSQAVGTKVEISTCAGYRSQNWEYIPGAAAGGAGQLRIHGKCISTGPDTGNGEKATLQRCNGSAAGQKWAYQSLDQLANPHSGKCLYDPTESRKNGTQVVLWTCSTSGGESWMLPAGPVLAGVAGRCLTDPGDSAAAGTRIEIAGCSGSSSQKWVMQRDGWLQIRGRCLNISGGSLKDGGAAVLADCSRSASQEWAIGPDGGLVNGNSGRCLADPASKTASGTKLVQEDCYGESGEIWAIS